MVEPLLLRSYAAIRFAKVLDVKRLLWVAAASFHRYEIADGYQIRMPSREAMARAVEAKEYPAGIGTPDALEDPRNTLLTAHRGDQLAAYLWFANHTVDAAQNYSRAPHLGTPLRLAPGIAFAYNAWTAPEHRGQRLLPAMLSRAVAPEGLGPGGLRTAGLVTTTDWTNAAALAAFRRVGFTQLGLIYRFGWPGCNLTRAPSGLSEYGIEIGRGRKAGEK